MDIKPTCLHKVLMKNTLTAMQKMPCSFLATLTNTHDQVDVFGKTWADLTLYEPQSKLLVTTLPFSIVRQGIHSWLRVEGYVP